MRWHRDPARLWDQPGILLAGRSKPSWLRHPSDKVFLVTQGWSELSAVPAKCHTPAGYGAHTRIFTWVRLRCHFSRGIAGL